MINSNFVLTSSDCVCGIDNNCDDTQDGWKMEVYLTGENSTKYFPDDNKDISSFSQISKISGGFMTIKAKKVFSHQTADAALVLLDKPVAFSDHIKPICLDEHVEENPICSDLGKDKRNSLIYGDYTPLLKDRGGCVISGGWGQQRGETTCLSTTNNIRSK